MSQKSSSTLSSRIKELEAQLGELRSQMSDTSTFDILLEGADFTSTDVAKSVIDTNFTIIDVNERRLEGTGLKRENIIGNKCYSVFYGLNKACDECSVQEVINSKSSKKFLRSYVQEERLHFEEKTVSPILNEYGELERLVVQSNDITSYHNLVDKVGQREEIYQRIFESSGDAFLVHDEEGRLLEFGSKLPKLLEYSSEELKDLNVKDIDDPTSSMEYNERKDNIRNGGDVVFETELISKSGKRIPVEVNANIMEVANTSIFFVAIRNIEKRKIAEEKLRESEERFRTLVENAPDLIMRFDKNHKHIFVNSAAKHVLNIDPSEFIGKTHLEMGFPKDLCVFWETEMDKVFHFGEMNLVEFSLEVNQDLRYFEWQLIPEKNIDDKYTSLLAIARDITARKKSELALNEAIKTKDKFFSIIAHDLKNPFNALLPISKTLVDSSEHMEREQITEMANLIHTSVKQEYNLLENLLEWSRAQMGKLKCTPRPVDLADLLYSNLLLYEAKANKKKITLSITANGRPVVFADEYMIDAVVRNLLSNALKFTNVGGEVQVVVTVEDKALSVLFKDNGIGISSKNIEKLFRIDTNYVRPGTNEESGTGLGLILCKEFIEQNNGTISVSSEVGVGSAFKITLPLHMS